MDNEFKEQYNKEIEEVMVANNIINNESVKVEQELMQTRMEMEEEKQQQDIIIKHLIEVLNNTSKYNKLEQATNNIKIYCFGFKVISKVRTVLITSTNNIINKDTPITIYLATKDIKDYINNNIELEERIKNNNNMYVLHNPLFSFTVNGIYYNKQRNPKPLINIEEEEEEDLITEEGIKDTINNNRQYSNKNALKTNYISSKCNKIEDMVKQGDIIKVIGAYKWKGTHLLQIFNKTQDQELTCKSNKWMDDLLEKHNNQFYVVVGIAKRHPISKRCCVSFVLPDS